MPEMPTAGTFTFAEGRVQQFVLSDTWQNEVPEGGLGWALLADYARDRAQANQPVLEPVFAPSTEIPPSIIESIGSRLQDTADACRNIDLEALSKTINETAAKAPDWTSPAETMYRTRRQLLQSKWNTTKSAIEDIIREFDNLQGQMDSYWLGLAFYLAGLVLALVGLVVTLATAGTGVGAIIGICVAVASLLVAAFAALTLPDIPGEVHKTEEKFQKLLGTVNTTWGELTADSEWTW